MASVKRALLFIAVVAAAATLSAPASAKVPCRDRIYNDWDRDGKIASTYPLSCYRDALKHVPPDAGVYSGLIDDIKSALQAAIARARGHHVPAQVGRSGPVSELVSSPRSASPEPKARPRTSSPQATPPAPVAPPGSGSEKVSNPTTPAGDSSGVPTPVLVLGALALLLLALGAAGLGVRRFRKGV